MHAYKAEPWSRVAFTPEAFLGCALRIALYLRQSAVRLYSRLFVFIRGFFFVFFLFFRGY